MFSPEMNKHYSLIDRSSPMPAYQQVASSMIQRISQNEWEINERLPTENELAIDYEVSRVTMRQALALLEKDDIIKKRQGIGVFVTYNPKVVVQDLTLPSIHSRENPKTHYVPSKVLSMYEGENLPKRIYAKLQLNKDAPIVYLQRLFYQEQKIIGVNNVWFPKNSVPDLLEKGLLDNSISKTLLKWYGYEAVSIENFIEAIKLDAVNAQLLESVYDAAALKIESIHCLEGGTPIEFASTIWIGEVTRFRFKVS